MKKFLLALVGLLIATPAFADITLSNLVKENAGSETKISGTIAFDDSYPTGGEALTLSKLPLKRVSNVLIETNSGYVFQYDYTNNKIIAYRSAGATFTGTASTSAEVSAFTGTGQSSSGQVITTTDNQTMTLNQCAGMWFVSAVRGPYYIVSNTAVTNAPAVLTVMGTAPVTDAGAYRIVKSPTPVGTNATAALAEVANGVDLAGLTAVKFTAYGK